MRAEPAVTIPVAVAMLAVALADGGFSGQAIGIASVAVWVTITGLLSVGRIGFGNAYGALAWTAGALAGLAALTALSISWGSDDAAAFEELNRLLLYLGVVVGVALAARRGSFPAWLGGIAIGGVAIAIVALGSRLLGFGGDRELALILPQAAERLSYPIGYWNGLGYLMAMVVTALLWFAAAGGRRVAGIALAATIPVVVVIFLTSSRGAVVTLLIGAVCVAWLLPRRSQLLAALIVGVPAWLAAIVAVAARRGTLEPPAEPGLWGIALACGIVLLGLLAAAAFPLIARRQIEPRLLRRVGPVAVIGAGLAVVAAVAVIGPNAFVGTFRGETITGDTGTAAGLVSGSDRTVFWSTAFDAFGEDPLRGIGSGGYANYWNQHGSLGTPVQNAHSAPIETLAELGIGGALLFGLVLLAPLWLLWRRLREAAPELRSALGPVLGILLIGVFAVGIDWTWDLPAAIAPVLICVGLLSGGSLRARQQPHGSQRVAPGIAGYEWVDAPVRPALVWLRGGVAAVTVLAVWSGTVLALAAIQLGISTERLAEGDLVGAAKAARSAAVIEPWASAPSLRLAEVEKAGGNYEAARRRAEIAVRKAPDDFLSWLLLAQVEKALGHDAVSAAYSLKAVMLAPKVLSRTVVG